MVRKLFSYDDVCLRPRYSELLSRGDADTSVNLYGYTFSLPVVSSNMEDVISFDNAKFLSENGYFYIMHRFNHAPHLFVDYICEHNLRLISLSIGVNNDSKEDLAYSINKLHNKDRKIDFLCIDTAHSHHIKTKNMINYIMDVFDGYGYRPKIIAGNVATADGYKYLCDLRVDVVKVGIGSGQICTTARQTGFHLPTAYSVYECAQLGLDVPIIADGGSKYYGDVAKALTLGATMVMSGGWFASCLDSPAKIVGGKKLYRGSTSYEVKGQKKHIEGKQLELDEGITYAERMEEIRQSLASSISYAGGKDLSCFNNVEWSLI